MSDWVCSGCGRHFSWAQNECPYCRCGKTATTTTYEEVELSLYCSGCERFGANNVESCKVCKRFYSNYRDLYTPVGKRSA